MPRRGPKPKTADNSRHAGHGVIGWADAEPPDDLGPEERAVFAGLVETLHAAGTLAQTDPTLVELYAVNKVLLRDARAEVRRDGQTIANSRGVKVPHPALATINSATIRLRAIISDLGLNPATARYGGSPARGDGDAMAEFLKVTG